MRSFPHRRSEPRIPIKPLHRLSFSWNRGGQSIPLAVSNISRRGIGFLREGEVELPSEGVIEGHLIISAQSFLIHPKIVFSNDQAIGCQITDTTAASDRAIEDYFKVELLGLHLKENPDPPYETDPPLQLQVWNGENNCEVLTVINQEKLQRYKITVFGNVFDGGDGRELAIGEIIQGDDFNDFSSGGRVTLTKNISEIDTATKQTAMRFVDVLEELSPEHREFIRSQLMAFPVSQD